MTKLWKKFIAWRSKRPVVPFFSSWFPRNRKRIEEIRKGSPVRFFDPWF